MTKEGGEAGAEGKAGADWLLGLVVVAAPRVVGTKAAANWPLADYLVAVAGATGADSVSPLGLERFLYAELRSRKVPKLCSNTVQLAEEKSKRRKVANQVKSQHVDSPQNP